MNESSSDHVTSLQSTEPPGFTGDGEESPRGQSGAGTSAEGESELLTPVKTHQAFTLGQLDSQIFTKNRFAKKLNKICFKNIFIHLKYNLKKYFYLLKKITKYIFLYIFPNILKNFNIEKLP